MRLYLLPSWYSGEDSITLEGSSFNYLINVLRLKKDNLISARDRKGNFYNLSIVTVSKNSCTLSVEKCSSIAETTDSLPEDRPTKPIVLYQCLPKGRKADEIIKRATEIGVYKIVLVKSKNCISDLSGKEIQRLSRYDSVITEAIQQSGSTVPTSVEGILDIEEVPKHLQKCASQLNMKSLGLVLHQCKVKKDQNSLYDSVVKFDGVVGIIVGPEGGLEEKEVQSLLDNNFKAVLLKTNILRCETAAVYAISAVQTIVESTCV